MLTPNKEKTFVDAVVNGSKVTEASKDEIEIERLQTALQKSSDKLKVLEKQYDECEAALRKSIVESERLKSELKDLKLIMKMEKELEKTPSKTPEVDHNSSKIGRVDLVKNLEYVLSLKFMERLKK